MISAQELRRAIKDINNPPPQPEDPERLLDLASQEDPDILVELIAGVFHQLSIDNALVAITADYPGILPASQVTETEVQYFENDPSVLIFYHRIPMVFRRGSP